MKEFNRAFNWGFATGVGCGWISCCVVWAVVLIASK